MENTESFRELFRHVVKLTDYRLSNFHLYCPYANFTQSKNKSSEIKVREASDNAHLVRTIQVLSVA